MASSMACISAGGSESRETERMDKCASVEAGGCIMWRPGNVETILVLLREAMDTPDED